MHFVVRTCGEHFVFCSVDPFTRKEWYVVKAPSMFEKRNVGHTLVNRTQGTRIASEGLKGRVFEVSLGDLNTSEDVFRKFRLIVEDVQGEIWCVLWPILRLVACRQTLLDQLPRHGLHAR